MDNRPPSYEEVVSNPTTTTHEQNYVDITNSSVVHTTPSALTITTSPKDLPSPSDIQITFNFDDGINNPASTIEADESSHVNGASQGHVNIILEPPRSLHYQQVCSVK